MDFHCTHEIVLQAGGVLLTHSEFAVIQFFQILGMVMTAGLAAFGFIVLVCGAVSAMDKAGRK